MLVIGQPILSAWAWLYMPWDEPAMVTAVIAVLVAHWIGIIVWLACSRGAYLVHLVLGPGQLFLVLWVRGEVYRPLAPLGLLLGVRVNAVVGGGNNDHGLLVGYATNVDMSDVVVQGSVGGYIRLGGVAGRVQGGLLDLIRVDGVTITATGGTAGGVAGQLQGTAVRGAAVDATVQGGSVVGGVVGHVNVTGELQRVRFTGSVTGTNRVGGLVGWLAHAQTLANVVWDVTAVGTVTGMVGVGGLVGEGSPSGLARAYAAVDVTGVDRVGGLLGAGDQGGMRDSFFAGTVQGNAGLPNVGLILGEQTPGPGVMMQNLHVTQESTATNAGGAVNTLGTPQSSPLASFQGAGAAPVSTLLYMVWDFLLVWRVTPGGLPLLAGPP